MADKTYTLESVPWDPTTGGITFLVQGSEPEPYQVQFWKKGKNLTARCTCRAGQFGQYCRHRVDILSGNIKKLKIASKNPEDIETVRAWLPGTDVETAINQVREAQKVVDEATIKLKGYKKKLARVLMD